MSERYNSENSLNELRQAGKEMKLFISEGILAHIPEEYWDLPLSEWAETFKLPWGDLLPASMIVHDANLVQDAESLWEWVPLWVKAENYVLDSNDLSSVALMQVKDQLKGIRPAVIVCPGGAYENIVFDSEGYFTAKRFNEAGYRAFVLNYRYRPNRFPLPQMDLALAIRHVRMNAELYQIDPDSLMVCGYSAGAHLCASTAALQKEIDQELIKELKDCYQNISALSAVSSRPDKMCLCYPVISFLSEVHEGSFQNLTGGDESLREHLSVERHVHAKNPKTFIWTCMDDSHVPPSNSIRMEKALIDQNIPVKCMLYPQGEHGCSLGEGTSAAGWFDEMIDFFGE